MGAAIAGFVVTFLAVPVLARLARVVGLGDDPGVAPHRKRQRAPVPPVGGLAILLGMIAARLLWHPAALDLPFGEVTLPRAPFARPETPFFLPALGLDGTVWREGWVWGALLLAFGTGLVDDLVRGGLRPRAKLVGQALAGCALAAAMLPPDVVPHSGLGSVAIVALAVVAQNVVNTWDHADGLATTLGVLGNAFRGGLALGPTVGFLPWNLFARRKDGDPVAYLGDSGSHLVALTLLLASGWGVLILPALDLVRLVGLRLAARRAPWDGDRRHLGHRLQAAGLGPLAVALVAHAPLVPFLLVVTLGVDWLTGLPAPVAFAVAWGPCAVFLAVLVALTVDPVAGTGIERGGTASHGPASCPADRQGR